jgi:hypothetical protein
MANYVGSNIDGYLSQVVLNMNEPSFDEPADPAENETSRIVIKKWEIPITLHYKRLETVKLHLTTV